MSGTNELVQWPPNVTSSEEYERAFEVRTREAIAALGPANCRCIEACEREFHRDFRHHGRRAKVRRVAP